MEYNNQGKSKNSVHKKGMATQEACDRIKRLIFVKDLVPGQKLIYGDVARKLDMGVTPVIQALNRLESSNLVRYEPNKGYFVGEITEDETRQLYQAREALEVSVVPAIVRNFNSEKLDEIRQVFRKRREARRPRREVFLDDTFFHLMLIRYADNEVTYNLLKCVFEQIYLKYRLEYVRDDRIEVLLKEHRAILDSLIKGDVEEAIVCVRKHIRLGREYIIQSIRMDKPGF